MANSSKGGLLPEAERAYLEGNYARSEKWTRIHLASDPTDRDAKTLLGILLLKKGEADDAVRVLREAETYEAHVALATYFLSVREIESGLEHALRATELEPGERATYRKFVDELRRLGRSEQAIPLLEAAVAHMPNDSEFLPELASALYNAGRKSDALATWRRLTKVSPHQAVGWLNVGMLELGARDLDSALDAGERAVAAEPDNPEGYMLIGLAYSEKGRAERAEPYFRRAIERKPNHALAHASLGVAIYTQGRFSQALEHLEKSTQLWETNGLAYYISARSKKVSEADRPWLVRQEGLLERNDLGLLDRSFLEYSLGKSYEDLGDFEAAITHYDRANATAHAFWMEDKPWDRQRYRNTIDRTIEVFSAEKIAELREYGNPTSVPVVIVGMIRSGTSLLEQIVSSHPRVSGAGELTYWHEVGPEIFDVHVGAVHAERLFSAAEDYVSLLRTYGPESDRVTDKLPHNYALLGFLHPAMPNARILHIRRNPIDNCLSIYATAYSKPPGFTLKRENIVFAYREYQRLMAHWRSVLPADRFMELDYEDLIANREPLTRRIIDFLGLEWDDRCLQHEKNARTVHTPSAWQVRQPIYASSIERWRGFAPWIAPFDELLG